MADEFDLTTVEGLRASRIVHRAEQVIGMVNSSKIEQRRATRLVNEMLTDAYAQGAAVVQQQFRRLLGIEQPPTPATVDMKPLSEEVSGLIADAFTKREQTAYPVRFYRTQDGSRHQYDSRVTPDGVATGTLVPEAHFPSPMLSRLLDRVLYLGRSDLLDKVAKDEAYADVEKYVRERIKGERP